MNDIQELIEVIRDLPIEFMRQLQSYDAAKEAQVNKRNKIQTGRNVQQQLDAMKFNSTIGGSIQYIPTTTTDNITTDSTTTTVSFFNKMKHIMR